jgi:hypothetical protein
VAFVIVWPQEMAVWHSPNPGKESNPSTTDSQRIQKGRRDERAEDTVLVRGIKNSEHCFIIIVDLLIAFSRALIICLWLSVRNTDEI